MWGDSKNFHQQTGLTQTHDALFAAYKQNRVLWYEVDVTHFSDSGHRRFFGREVHMAWGDYDPIANTRTTKEFDDVVVSNRGLEPPDCPDFKP